MHNIQMLRIGGVERNLMRNVLLKQLYFHFNISIVGFDEAPRFCERYTSWAMCDLHL